MIMLTTYYLQGIRFEWDGQKASKNLRKHGITFEEACEVGTTFGICGL
jgi:uncharacterized DUF497 family protein